MNAEAFRGQVVIVTGASAGIGKALALQLARQGAKLLSPRTASTGWNKLRRNAAAWGVKYWSFRPM